MNIENLEKWHFELTEDACNSLLDLVLKGQKRATSSSLAAFELGGETMPKEGELSVITDWDGNPRCVVRTKKLHILPYEEITYDLAKLEGEDETLDSWKRSHERFFTREGEMLGYHFSPQMPVVFEEFEVVELL
ncbi:cytoplasmic protein [Streptococcus equinus]|uniref:ASCH domain-containing protein n=1 Tax=Streptococcus equinus TaxID=1335 RepID=UPI000F6C0CC9|nr:ASCH domain-containing protein [Streptococcus equinus]VED92222.1 cytoplasmic protein [Streptococcus equinus]VTS88235.1 cytoplasmic protein [Streptococcus equinus]